MRPMLSLGTRGTVLILPSFSTNGERCNYPFRSPLIENSPCRSFGTCGLAPLVGLRERFLDQLANNGLHELCGFLDGDADGLSLVSDLSLEIRRESDSLFAQLMFEEQKRDLTLSDVVHDGPPVNVLLPRNLRSPDSQVHLRNAMSIAENNLAVKSNRGNRKALILELFIGFCIGLKNFRPLKRNREFSFEPKIQYARAAEL